MPLPSTVLRSLLRLGRTGLAVLLLLILGISVSLSVFCIINTNFLRPLPQAALDLSVGFAAIALLLAAIGLGAGISAAVSESRREIGIRAALGENRQSLAVRVVLVVPVVMTAIAVLASALPVRRALGISPLEVLRSD